MRPVISLSTQNATRANFYGARGRVGRGEKKRVKEREREREREREKEKVKDTGAEMNTKQAKERLTGREPSEGD